MAGSVTFIIGNGLDLSLGLKTSYKDFYDYVQKMKLHPDNKIYEAIKKDPETWSDFERSLGLYTQYIEDVAEKNRLKESVAFHNQLEELIEDLADFLEIQDNLSEDAASSIKLTRNSFLEELPEGQRNIIYPHLSNPLHEYNFITLNYTRTLEKILLNMGDLAAAQRIRLGNVHHIHGDLSLNVTLGVSDETQLSSVLMGAEKDDLIKPRIIESMNDGRINVMKRLIDTSSVVVLFGTSIGATDKYIWSYLVQWLSSNYQHFIIIHKHDSEYTNAVERLQRRKKLFISKVQNTLLDNATFDDDDEKAELRNRIFVIHNTKKMFTIPA